MLYFDLSIVDKAIFSARVLADLTSSTRFPVGDVEYGGVRWQKSPTGEGAISDPPFHRPSQKYRWCGPRQKEIEGLISSWIKKGVFNRIRIYLGWRVHDENHLDGLLISSEAPFVKIFGDKLHSQSH